MNGLNTNQFAEAATFVSTMHRPLLISHAKPDGDALGSLAGLRSMFRARGVDALALVYDDISGRYALFNRFAPMPVWGKDAHADDLREMDGVIVLDTCTYNQLGPIADWLRASRVPKLAVDHHVTRDELANHYLVDESAAATCLMLHEWAKAVGWSADAEAHEALFVGVAMDTGWFRHSNTDARALAAAAELVETGVDANRLYDALFLRETPGRVRLLGAALSTLALHAEDSLAVMGLSAAAIRAAGATAADTEDIVNDPLRIGSVVVSVLLVEQADGVIRASFRSKPPGGDGAGAPQRPEIDVAKIAQSFGGGGHARAAGAKIKGNLDAVRGSVVERLTEALGGYA